jgi:hypothetical protein
METEINKMNVICNIQQLNEIINPKHIGTYSFKSLNKLSVEELEAEQARLIPIYNEHIAKKKMK